MRTLVLLALAGFAAQLVDGSLGMGYGITSTTLLLLIGATPATASASVHLAELGTNLASGVSHWRFGNVDWKVVRRIGIPGAIGAFLGATVLSRLSTETAKPFMSLLLVALGIYVIARISFGAIPRPDGTKPLTKRFLTPLGLFAGFLDASGGGGWGPVGTPALLSSGRIEPRKVIGSIDTSELLVSAAASLGFFIGLGSESFNLGWIAALLIGGVIAAPAAAWLVRVLAPQLLGALAGGMIVFTNVRTLVGDGIGPVSASPILWLVAAAWATIVAVVAAALWRSRSIIEPEREQTDSVLE